MVFVFILAFHSHWVYYVSKIISPFSAIKRLIVNFILAVEEAKAPSGSQTVANKLVQLKT